MVTRTSYMMIAKVYTSPFFVPCSNMGPCLSSPGAVHSLPVRGLLVQCGYSDEEKEEVEKEEVEKEEVEKEEEEVKS